MSSISKFFSWLMKLFLSMTAIAFIVMYICSFLWYKMGLSHTQTLFGYAVIDANVNIDIPKVNEGDLIIAKEYLCENTPKMHDVVVYNADDKFEISIIEKVSVNKDDKVIYQVVSSRDKESINIYKDDIIGELVLSANEVGKVGTFLVSPTFIAIIYAIIAILIITYKVIKKRKQLSNKSIETTTEVDIKEEVVTKAEIDTEVEVKEEVVTETETNAEVKVEEEVVTKAETNAEVEVKEEVVTETETNTEVEVEEEVVTEAETNADVEVEEEVVTEAEANTDVEIEEEVITGIDLIKKEKKKRKKKNKKNKKNKRRR